jgi:polyhydroxyalkanoate synthesis regulator phasin
VENRMISVPGTTRYETVFDDRDFEDLLDKHISSEAADYYRDRIRELEEEIEELKERIKELEDELYEQKTRE